MDQVKEQVEKIAEWVRSHAAEKRLEAKTYPEAARCEDEWIYLPVRIQGKMSAFKRAERLQALEEDWRKLNGTVGIHLLLIPAPE